MDSNIELAPNPLEKQIIIILCEEEFYDEEDTEKYQYLADLPDAEIVKRIFEANIQKEYKCTFSELYKTTDCLVGWDADSVPLNLFQAAMQVAIEYINWSVVAQDEDVVNAIKKIKNK